jgi:hypothetical protein
MSDTSVEKMSYLHYVHNRIKRNFTILTATSFVAVEEIAFTLRWGNRWVAEKPYQYDDVPGELNTVIAVEKRLPIEADKALIRVS